MLLERRSTGCVALRPHVESQFSNYVRCIEEVKYYVHNLLPSHIIHAVDGGVIKSDDSVEVSLKDEIKKGAATLMRIRSRWKIRGTQ